MPFDARRPSEIIVVIDVGDAIDVRNADAIAATCNKAVRDGARQFIFDLRGTTLIDSEGIGMLISLRQLVTKVGEGREEIILSGLRAKARTTFELTRTERLFTFTSNFEDALESLKEPER